MKSAQHSIQPNCKAVYSDSLLHLLLCEVLFALKRPREWCETWLLAAQKVRQTNEAFLSQKVFPKNVPPLKKDLIRQPWWWQGLHTFGAKRQKESCCQARLVVALCAEMSFSWTFLGKRNCAHSSLVFGRLFRPSDISKKTVPPLFIAFSNWYGFLWPPHKISGCVSLAPRKTFS